MQSDSTQSAWFYDMLGWLDTHKKQTMQGVVAIAIFAVIVSFIFYRHDQKEDAAAAGFARLILTRASADDYLKFQAENRSSQAGPKALLMAAQELFAAGNYPEAQAQFAKFRQEYRNNAFASTAALGVAACLDAQGKTDEAITAYTDLAQRRTGDMVTVQSEFALGRLYETKGQLDKAVEHYDIVVQMSGNSGFADESFVHAAELRAAHPELVKVAPVAPAAPVAASPVAPVK